MTGQHFPTDYAPGRRPDTWREIAVDAWHAYGHHFGRAVILGVVIFLLFQVCGFFREVDQLRATVAAIAVEQAQAPPTRLTAAIPSSGERLVWGPPMYVVIEGRPYSLRMVIEEGRP